MKSPIVNLVELEVANFRKLRVSQPSLFPQNDRLYPIPFFGDIRRAEVVTLALNPAHTEFSEVRCWPINNEVTSLTPIALTNRLLCYFHNHVPPHPFFLDCENALSNIGCSYKTNAAHIDVHPYPTAFAAELKDAGRAKALAKMIDEHSSQHLQSVLQLFNQLKLIIVIDFAVQLGEGEWRITYDYVRRKLGSLSGLVNAECSRPPLLRGGGRSEIAKVIVGRREELQSFLRTAPPLVF